MKRVILCYKEHDKSFIWYYYAYDIWKEILDLDPDLCQNFLFFLISSILHIETFMTPLSKAVHKGFISFFLYLRASSNLWGRYDPKTEKTDVFACNWGFLYIESCIMLWLKAPFQTFISFSYTDKVGVICEDVMTKKHENLMIFQCFQQSDSPYLFYVTCLWKP